MIRNLLGNQIGGICVKNIAISENHLYKKVYAKGSKAVCKHIVVYVLTDYHASRLQRENPLKKRINRVGLTVSTRLGKAVVRSRVRRILRAVFIAGETRRLCLSEIFWNHWGNLCEKHSYFRKSPL